MYCCKAVCRALLLSTPKQVNKNNDYIFIQIHLFTVFVWSKNRTHFFFSLSPIPVRIRRQTEPQPTLRLCAVHFRRETYCRFQVLHSACIWKHRRSHSSHLSERVGRGKLIVQSPFRLQSPFSKTAYSSCVGRSSRDP